MAEFGKGDPRWLVDDRADGRNVNAWHWTERDCTKWFKKTLSDALKDITLCSHGDCKAKEVEKLDGEMTYCNRKRKHMFFYEVELRLKWEANIDDTKITGQIRAPSICDEEPIESMEMRVTTTSKSQEGDILKKKLQQEAIPKLREVIKRVVGETLEHFKEPLPDEAMIKSKSQTQNTGVLIQQEKPTTTSKSMKNISMKLLFCSSPELMYQCLTDPQRLSFFTQSSAQMENKNGGKFSYFGGQVTGTNKTLVCVIASCNIFLIYAD